MTLADLYTQVHQRTALLARRRRDDTIASMAPDEPAIRTFALQGATEIALATKRIERHTAINVVAGTASYDAPVDVDRPTLAVLGTTVLRHIDGKEAKAEAAAKDPGTPTRYGFYGGELCLDRRPVEAATLTLYYLSSTLTDDEGELLSWLPAEFDRMLVDYTVAEWYENVGEWQEGRRVRDRYLQDLNAYLGNDRAVKITKRPLVSF